MGIFGNSMKYYVYLHVTEDTGDIFYVGKGCGSRLKSKHKRNPHWRNVVAKHGFVSFVVSYFEEEREAYELEKLLISKLGFRQFGGILVNMTTGGDGTNNSHMRSEEEKRVTREKRSASLKRRWAEPEQRRLWTESIQSMSKDPKLRAKRSKNSKNMWSAPEYRDHISKRRQEMWKDPVQRVKRIAIMNDPEYRKNQSTKKTGRNSPKYRGDIAMIGPDGNIIGIFESAAACMEATGADDTMVCRKLKLGEVVKQGRFAGVRFEYVPLTIIEDDVY